MLLGECLDLLLGEEGENLKIFFCFLVAYVEPELVEAVGGGIAGVEPDVALFGLAEFGAVRFGDERAGECERLAAVLTADEFGACGDIAPLVAAAELQLAVFGIVKIQEVIPLKQLVSKFRERQSLAALLGETFFHAVFSHHVVDCDMLADFTREVEE